eukprot:10141416-Ditylum_brightwellii.AAC.1
MQKKYSDLTNIISKIQLAQEKTQDMVKTSSEKVAKELAQQTNETNTAIITTAATTAVSTITDDLRTNKKTTTVKEAHLEHDAATNVTMDGSDSTSTSTATTKPIVSNMPEVIKPKRSRLKSSLALFHRTRSSKRVQISQEEHHDKLKDGEKIDVTNKNQE